MKRILFIVNGAGLGNATRCDAIIEQIIDTYNITVLCSGNSHHYFKSNKKLNVLPISNYQYKKGRDGEISFLKTLFLFPTYLRIFFKNFFTIKKLIKTSKFNFVITDSDYSFVLLRFVCNAKFLAINNAPYIISNLKFTKSYILKCAPQFFIECMDFLIHRYFAHHILSPTFIDETKTLGKTTFIPPLVRNSFYQNQIFKKNVADLPKILILPSGSATSLNNLNLSPVFDKVNATFLVPKGFVTENHKVQTYDKYDDNSLLFKQADLIICNAGMSCLSEVYITGIPALIIPIKGHFEQRTNSIILTSLKTNVQNLKEGTVVIDQIKSIIGKKLQPTDQINDLAKLVNSIYSAN